MNEIQQTTQRTNNSGLLDGVLNRIVDLLEDMAKMKISLDSGALVGELVPAIDGRMSDRWQHSRRGNTR